MKYALLIENRMNELLPILQLETGSFMALAFIIKLQIFSGTNFGCLHIYLMYSYCFIRSIYRKWQQLMFKIYYYK